MSPITFTVPHFRLTSDKRMTMVCLSTVPLEGMKETLVRLTQTGDQVQSCQRKLDLAGHVRFALFLPDN